jgi:SAM-dependent methyltransferase
VTGHDSVRAAYDAVAGDYARQFSDELAHKPLDRALLRALVEEQAPGEAIADLGCGPGHVAAFMADLGASVVGIDLSARMIDIARRKHPAIDWRVGDLLDLPVASGELGAAVAFYCLIHLLPGEMPAALSELARVLGPRGRLLLAFHAGSGVHHRAEWYGHAVDLDFRFLEPDEVTAQLEAATFDVTATVQRSPYPGEAPTTRCYMLARKS